MCRDEAKADQCGGEAEFIGDEVIGVCHEISFYVEVMGDWEANA